MDGGILLRANPRIGPHVPKRAFMDLEKDLTDAFERMVLRDFPNPERVGCPSSDAFTKFALRPSAPEFSMLLKHVRRCAPCFSALKELRHSKK